MARIGVLTTLMPVTAFAQPADSPSVDAHGSAALPRLAGQCAAYFETQLKLFNQRQRNKHHAVTHAIVEKRAPLEMTAVAECLSGK